MSWSFPIQLIRDCGHMYCGACLDSWLKSKNTCPECRTMISREQPMIPAFKMGAVIDAYAKQTMGQEDLKERAKREIEWKQRQDRKRACERRHAKSSSSPSSPSSSPLPRRPRPLINSSFLDIFNEYWSTSGSSRRANQTPQPEPAPSPHQRLRRIGLGPRHYSQQAEGSSSTAPAPLVPRHAAPPSASAGVIGTLSSASVDGRPRYVLIKEREDANMNPNAGAGRNRSRNGSRNENGNAPMAPSPPSLSSSASSASATQSRSSSSSASATQSRSSSSSASATQSRSSSSSRSRNVISILSDDSDASSAASTPSDQAESSEPPRQPEYERITLRLPSNEEGAPRCCECREAIGPQALCYEVVPRVRAGTGVGEASEGAERRTRLYHVRCFAVPDEWRWIDPEARGRGRSRRESMGHVAADADVGTSVTRRVILDTNGMSFQQKVEARLEIL
ncbi:hypothetical protein BC936DRAFT_144259 [Jimgerdemannia flammicorona]|uniref:RING-type domain-containing protein n=1 Tax=Jimgerdemannia flammicorona TaxID=994334 RepID=A0A433DCU0_9FUNG|nr:hypothetical protein BC936DRAFT_144259 [Jimgerdemannia flammicorona]